MMLGKLDYGRPRVIAKLTGEREAPDCIDLQWLCKVPLFLLKPRKCCSPRMFAHLEMLTK